MTPTGYRFLTRLSVPMVLAYLWWRGRREVNYRAGLRERLALGEPLSGMRGRIWVHAASVGEVRAVVPVIEGLQRAGHALLVTTNTPGGRAALEQACDDGVAIAYPPLDTPGAVERFMAHWRPCAGVFVELELWPNRLLALAKAQVPVVLVNARLSERSLVRYQRLGELMPRALEGVRCVLAQTSADQAQLVQLGIPAERIQVAGNLKFDQALDETQISAGQALRRRIGPGRPVWVAASVREGEQDGVLTAHALLRETCPDALLILVPRHPQRGERPTGAVVAQRSLGEVVTPDTQILYADTLGELVMFLAAADVAFVGGSWVPVGGHNPLEPAALGLPVLMGPAVTNFQAVDTLLGQAGGRQQVADGPALGQALTGLFTDEAARQRAGEAARQVVSAHRGAADHTLAAIGELLN
ncbi:MAG: 3-deoxy-D-manno-octulosonic acid transferase [Spiribacter salinus]|uniref:3-deoxy-D-manno-octulosonic acid transferase n=1 Tax=Spiribacter salinus TaxID=1335746 RepID=A0A540VSW0_9GAMM|nr:MAG: 3-deoxy-D-manno-octulosonic acid transferase [Spiribacter salinus]